ncbi:hypothetical protein V6Z11_D12G155500 [Gossypium hirsutum]
MKGINVLFIDVFSKDGKMEKKNILPANPSEHSNSCPTFIHEGTPNGLKTISTGLPSRK